jgi:hypothetical protein
MIHWCLDRCEDCSLSTVLQHLCVVRSPILFSPQQTFASVCTHVLVTAMLHLCMRTGHPTIIMMAPLKRNLPDEEAGKDTIGPLTRQRLCALRV